MDVTLKPGKEIELESRLPLRYEFRPANGGGEPTTKERTLFVGTGKVSIQYERVFGDSSAGKITLDPTLSKLGTGKLDLEIKSDPPQEQKQEKDKEPFTVWGKEFGGLQAGLSLRPDEKRVYRHGEAITLVVRVRNVGKKTVKFEYIRQFLDENPPTVTNADGKTVPQPTLNVLGEHPPVEVTLEPGKEIELESRLAGGANLAGAPGIPYTLGPTLGTGTVNFQYERVFGNSSAGSITLDPTLSNLGTGKLELEIKPATEKK
jgi:hypothetical protein